MNNYSDLSALELGMAIRNQQVTAWELTQYFIQRIDAFSHLDCISQHLNQRALQQAQHLDALAAQGIYLSPFHGVPMMIKDSFAIAGQITQAGTSYLQDSALENAEIVTQLEDLGFIILAKAKMTELAFGLSGQNPIQGTPVNPCYEELVAPGGSSSGCAVAVAADLAPLALGGDTGGSVRVPAAFNGILGFKPSSDRLAGQGNFPLAHSLDSVGLMAKSIQDLLQLYPLLTSTQLAPAQRHLSYLDLAHFPENLAAEVLSAWQGMLHKLHQQGYQLSPWKIPQDFNFQQFSEWCSDIIAYEGYQLHGHLAENEQIAMWSVIRQRIQRGAHISHTYYQQLIQQREQCYQAFAASLTENQALILPMSPSFAPLMNAEDSTCQAIGPYSRPFNYLDVPAISFPIDYGQQQQPIAAQLVALKQQENALLAQLNLLIQDLNLHCFQLATKKIPT